MLPIEEAMLCFQGHTVYLRVILRFAFFAGTYNLAKTLTQRNVGAAYLVLVDYVKNRIPAQDLPEREDKRKKDVECNTSYVCDSDAPCYIEVAGST